MEPTTMNELLRDRASTVTRLLIGGDWLSVQKGSLSVTATSDDSAVEWRESPGDAKGIGPHIVARLRDIQAFQTES